MENKDLDINLAQRLKQLGITGWNLARIMVTQEGLEPNAANIKNTYASVKRAIDNPDSISLGLYKSIILHAGGTLKHTWDENIFSDKN